MVLSTGLGSVFIVFAFDLCNFVARQQSDYCDCSGLFQRPQGSDTKPRPGAFSYFINHPSGSHFLDYPVSLVFVAAGFITIEEQ